MRGQRSADVVKRRTQPTTPGHGVDRGVITGVSAEEALAVAFAFVQKARESDGVFIGERFARAYAPKASRQK
jgi:hypothetical protein